MSDQFKQFTNLQALAALRGVELRAIRNDAERWTFIATVGPVTTELPSLEAVSAWLETLAQPSATEAESAA